MSRRRRLTVKAFGELTAGTGTSHRPVPVKQHSCVWAVPLHHRALPSLFTPKESGLIVTLETAGPATGLRGFPSPSSADCPNGGMNKTTQRHTLTFPRPCLIQCTHRHAAKDGKSSVQRAIHNFRDSRCHLVSTSIQLREMLYTDSRDMVLVSSTVTLRHYNCCTVAEIMDTPLHMLP
jgi:hypothetical protein